MIFIRNESFREYMKYYPIAFYLLAINLMVHLLNLLLGDKLLVLGRLYFNISYLGEAELWRYVTSIFLHADMQHLLFNCFSLFLFAPSLERLLGHVKFLTLYVLAGIMGNIASKIWYDNILNEAVVTVGASGAIYGVLGAYIYIFVYHRATLDLLSRRTLQIFLIIGIASPLIPLVFGGGRVNLAAHLGGFITGFLLFMLYKKMKLRSKSK
ncbi:rhomboid family intramembrane serine protease [Longirhabdus pacifica]|uniref:rhomboid family intramembrane serine protease n=1 Tax=Longirhabdus pacifica TaxID=2305227 RepID=UPI0010087179|nr:rhomboid family intramembrane serine protease [Longirhabdus pacifica]